MEFFEGATKFSVSGLYEHRLIKLKIYSDCGINTVCHNPSIGLKGVGSQNSVRSIPLERNFTLSNHGLIKSRYLPVVVVIVVRDF